MQNHLIKTNSQKRLRSGINVVKSLTEFNGNTKSPLSDEHAFCTICRCNFLISHGGKNDVLKHVNGKKHVELEN